MTVEQQNDGKTTGGKPKLSVGVDPTRPVGPGNPPAGTTFTSENNPRRGGHKGARHAKVIMREILSNANKVDDENLRKKLAQFLGKEPEEVTIRELGLVMQAKKMVEKSDTAAATFCFKTAGELQDDVNLIPPSTLRLDGVSAEEVSKLRAQILEEDL